MANEKKEYEEKMEEMRKGTSEKSQKLVNSIIFS